MKAAPKAILDCKNCGRQFYSAEDFLIDTSHWRVCSEDNLWFNCACSAINLIAKGQHSWFQPFSGMSEAAQSLFNQIPLLNDLPRLKASTMQLLQLIDDDNASSQALAAIARLDPILSLRILRIAENQAVLKQGQLKSLAHAITLVGRKQLKEIVLIAAMSCIEVKTKSFKINDFWDHSLTIGRIAEFLAKRFSPLYADDDVYISGCLCNLGKLVLATCRPEIADRFQNEVDAIHTIGPWTDAEARTVGFQHTVIGEIGAALWGLSASSTDAIRLHHSIASDLSAAEPLHFELIGLANQFAHWICLQPHRMDRKLFQKLLQRFQLTENDADAVAHDLMALKFQDAVNFAG